MGSWDKQVGPSYNTLVPILILGWEVSLFSNYNFALFKKTNNSYNKHVAQLCHFWVVTQVTPTYSRNICTPMLFTALFIIFIFSENYLIFYTVYPDREYQSFIACQMLPTSPAIQLHAFFSSLIRKENRQKKKPNRTKTNKNKEKVWKIHTQRHPHTHIHTIKIQHLKP